MKSLQQPYYPHFKGEETETQTDKLSNLSKVTQLNILTQNFLGPGVCRETWL